MVEFCDYVDAGGSNVMRAWVDGLPVAKRVKLDATLTAKLQLLRAVDRHQWGQKEYTKKLEGQCDGLFELRFKVGGVQYRPLFCDGPGVGEITFLAGATEHNDQLRPRSICRRALARKVLIGDPNHVCPSDFA